MSEPQGYLSAAYAHSLAEWGEPVQLPRSGGWLLRRKIPGSTEHDFMGLYPVFSCADWRGFEADLTDISKDGVAVSLVTDPFANQTLDGLQKLFAGRCYHYKRHYVADLNIARENLVSKHHQREVRRALRKVKVYHGNITPKIIATWGALYEQLIKRHAISGRLRFSPAIFDGLFQTPGIYPLCAEIDGVLVGMSLWVLQGQVAYWHLAACNRRGYQEGAAYALMWHALGEFMPMAKWICLGGAAGTTEQDDGLTLFKQGWSSGVRDVYFCGSIFDKRKYDNLAAAHEPGVYFPLYRKGEFHDGL